MKYVGCGKNNVFIGVQSTNGQVYFVGMKQPYAFSGRRVKHVFDYMLEMRFRIPHLPPPTRQLV